MRTSGLFVFDTMGSLSFLHRLAIQWSATIEAMSHCDKEEER